MAHFASYFKGHAVSQEYSKLAMLISIYFGRTDRGGIPWQIRRLYTTTSPKLFKFGPGVSPSEIYKTLNFFVSTKFHFDKTISLARLVSSLFVVRRCATFMETLRWDNFCNFGATLLRFCTLFTNIILLWIRNFETNRTTPTPKKTKKKPKKDLWIFPMG